MGSVVLVDDVFMVIKKENHPPMIPSAINFPTSTDFDVGTVVDLDEVPMSFVVGLFGPELDIFGG